MQGCKSGLMKKSETLQLMPKYMGVQISTWSGSLCLESGEWSRFTVKSPNNLRIVKYIYSELKHHDKMMKL